MAADMKSVLSSDMERIVKMMRERMPLISNEDLFQSVMVTLADLLRIPVTESPESVTKVEPPKKNKKLVRGYLDGCFDLMHSGHFNALRQAKMLCDVLVAGVHSDEEISANKGPPVMKNEERLAAVKACKWVDEIVFGTPYAPSVELLDKLNCDFCVHGDDTSSNPDGTDAYARIKQGGRLRVIKRTEGVSTTDLVGRLLLMTRNHHVPGPNPVNSIPTPRTPQQASCSPILGTLSASVPPVPALELGGSVLTPEKQKSQHYARGVSMFLPTTHRISQFSNRRVPKMNDAVVYIGGAFDLFHIGHIETLKKARALGDFLYVGIHTDQVVNDYMGQNFPIMNMHERVLNVLSCKYVDEVVIGAPWSVPPDLVRALHIKIVVAGPNEEGGEEVVKKMGDPHFVAKQLGIFKQLGKSQHQQLKTSDVVQRIITNRLQYEKRNKTRAKKELDYYGGKQYIREL